MRRWFGIVGVAGLLSATAALAQPPREDPGAPPVNPASEDAGWQVLRIPGLPVGALLGDVWAAPSGEVFVWASYPPKGLRAYDGDPPEGEKIPGGGVSQPRSSTLYRYDGFAWSAVLVLPGQTGVALYGTDASNVWASTTAQDGQAHLYAFDGRTWSEPLLAGYYLGRLHTLAGTPDDLYMRIDRIVLHRDPDGIFRNVYEQPGDATPVRGLVRLACGCVIALASDGMVVKHDGHWSEMPAGFAFAEIEDAWGMRDEHGALQLYALGSNTQGNGIRMWRYTETDPVTHAGSWGGVDAPVIADPPGAGVPGIGTGFHAWGYTHDDVYAAGVVGDEGHLMRFDGTNWQHLLPPEKVGMVHGVWGTPAGTVWFSVADGRVLRYQRPNNAPDLSSARASLGVLWPATGKLVPIALQGIRDPEDDAFTIRILGVTQDEAPMREGWGTTCPDAVIDGAQVFLRAEHAENGDGRVYDIAYAVTDRLGSESRGHLIVCAPHCVEAPCDPNTPTPFNSLGPCDPVALAADGTMAAREVGGVLEVNYALGESGVVHLGLYDVAGRCVGTVQSGTQSAGPHRVVWNSSAVRPGIYFLKLRGERVNAAQRIVLVR